MVQRRQATAPGASSTLPAMSSRRPAAARHRPAHPRFALAAGARLAPLVILAACGCVGGEGSEFFSRAAGLAERGLPLEAAGAIAERIHELPGDRRGEAWGRMASYYHSGGAYTRALAAATRAEEAGVRTPDVLLARGDSLLELSRLDEARKVLEELLSTAPEHSLGKLSLARLLFRIDDPEEALPLFQAYLDDRKSTMGRSSSTAGRCGPPAASRSRPTSSRSSSSAVPRKATPTRSSPRPSTACGSGSRRVSSRASTARSRRGPSRSTRRFV